MWVIWTDQANKSLDFIMTCSGSFYTKALLRRLNTSIKQAENILATNAYAGALEPLAEGREYEYRHIVLCKPFKLIYFIAENSIYIADIWDTRQSPQTLTKRLV